MRKGGPDGLEGFHPLVAEWFRTRVGTPSAPQREAWPEIAAGRSVLVSAPTGAGKTLAAFLEAIDRLFVAGLAGELPEGVHVLYVSPLKALNNDISRNLDRPLSEIRDMCAARGIAFPEIRKAVRTGDTTASERQGMLKKPPHILITTPESLFLLLTSARSAEFLKHVRYLILDEIHAVLGTKRGAHLSLSVERLAALTAPGLVRIGLSATVNPPSVAALFLGGLDAEGAPNPVRLVAPPLSKLKDLMIEMPVADYRTLETGSVWPEIYDTVFRLVKAHTATIVFVNNRATAERITANVNDLAGGELCIPHHGSLSKERRQDIEHRFKTGDIRCMVATATLELGIDVGQVDLMIQIAAPISISGGLQRLGRAGHRLDAVSRGRIIPKTRGDLLKSVFIAREMLAGRIEETMLPREPLDVMAQHLVSMACGGRWTEEALLAVIRRSASYRAVRSVDLHKVLSMLSGDYEHREDIPAKPRLSWDRVNGTVEGTPYSRMLAISAGGTIPDRGMYPVVLSDGHTRIGELDEEYVFESRMGDIFLLGNTPWRMDRIEKDRVTVSPAASAHGAETPFWKGDGLGMPYQQGIRYGAFLREMEPKLDDGSLIPFLTGTGLVDETGAVNLAQYLSDQRDAAGVLPNDRRLVVETVADADAGMTVILHAPFGGRVNATLETLLRHGFEDDLRIATYTTHTDEIILLYLYAVTDALPSLLPLLKPDGVERTLLRILPSSARFSIAFRHNAYRSLMMGTRRHGSRLPMWVQRLKSVEVLDQAVRAADHPLVVETMRECLEEAFDLTGSVTVLEDLAAGRISVHPVQSWYPSPFASEVMMRFESELLYHSPNPHPGGVRKPVVSGMDALHLPDRSQARPNLDPLTVRAVALENRVLPRFLAAGSANEVHSLLLMHGDLMVPADPAPEEAGAVAVLRAHLAGLLAEGRALCDAETGARWIAREEAELYRTAEPEAWPLTTAAAGEGETALKAGGEACGSSPPDLDPEGGMALPRMGETWSHEEACLRVLRRFARYAGPFREADAVARYRMVPLHIRQMLERLAEENFLVRGAFSGLEEDEWLHRVLWERSRQRGLRTAAAAVRSRSGAEYAVWLPGNQQVPVVVPSGGDIAGGRGTAPESGRTPADRVLAFLRQFAGIPFPAEWWENVLLPARVPGYQPGVLDRLCQTGRVCWRVLPSEDAKGMPVAFWDTEGLTGRTGPFVPLPEPECLEPEERAVWQVLGERGACFAHQLTSATGQPVTRLMQSLQSLTARGLVANDSFAPIRFFLEWNRTRQSAAFAKRLAMLTARMEMGRWERAALPPEPSTDARLDAWIDRWGIACREVADQEAGPAWTEAYELWKNREYAGKAQRGLFFEGLAGIQFLPAQGFPPAPGASVWHVLAACDPALAYGRILPHTSANLPFTRVPGTVVVLLDGSVVLTLDRNGSGFGTFLSGELLENAIRALCAAFREKRYWPGERLLAVKREMLGSVEGLEACLAVCGFEREPGRMVFRR